MAPTVPPRWVSSLLLERSSLALVLSGGNALGSFQGGAYQALHESGLSPDWIAGASAGAMNGAVICGNPPERRVDALRSLWQPNRGGARGVNSWPTMDEHRRTLAALTTLLAGKPGVFVPRNLFGPWWNPLGNSEPPSLYDSTPLVGEISRLADFSLINKGMPRLSLTAVDIGTGADVVMDTRTHTLVPDHVRASAALLPVFSPVNVNGAWLGDAGVSANLPLDTMLSDPGDNALVCIAVDLLPLPAPPPRTFGDVLCRAQDLIFATQSRRSLAAWQAIYDERARQGDGRSVTVIHLAYAEQQREVSGKAFDFSPESSAERWDAGQRDLGNALARMDAGEVEIGRPGLTIYRAAGPGGPLEQVRPALAPTPA